MDEQVKKNYALVVLTWVKETLMVGGAILFYMAYQVVYCGAEISYKPADQVMQEHQEAQRMASDMDGNSKGMFRKRG